MRTPAACTVRNKRREDKLEMFYWKTKRLEERGRQKGSKERSREKKMKKKKGRKKRTVEIECAYLIKRNRGKNSNWRAILNGKSSQKRVWKQEQNNHTVPVEGGVCGMWGRCGKDVERKGKGIRKKVNMFRMDSSATCENERQRFLVRWEMMNTHMNEEKYIKQGETRSKVDKEKRVQNRSTQRRVKKKTKKNVQREQTSVLANGWAGSVENRPTTVKWAKW